MQALIDLFGVKDLIPHGYCLSWSPVLLWLHVVSDVLITLAYYSIPLMLVHFIRQRKDLPYPGLGALFAGFIIACGTTHLLSVITIWIPLYWLDGLLKALAAIISVITAMLMIRVIPHALSAPSSTQLQAEIHQRRMAEDALRVANAALQENSARTQLLLDSALDGIISMDHNGNVVGWNAQAEHIFGYSSEQALGRKVAELIVPPAYRKKHLQGLSRFMITGVSNIIGTRLEVTGLRADASEFPLELAVDALGQKDDYFFSAYVRDISERKQADLVQKEALDKLQKIAAQLPGMVFQFRLRGDGSFCLPYASDVLRDIYRIDPEDVRDDGAKIFAVVHPDDLEQHLASIHTSARDLSPWRNEYRLRFADGAECWLFGNALPQREQDGSILWHGFVTDITERRKIEEAVRESENKLATILDNVEAFIYIKDCNYQYQYANQAARQVLGKSLENIIGKLDDAFFDEATTAKLRGNDRRVLELGERIAAENTYTQKDSDIISTYLTVKQPLRRKDGSIYGLCGISTDISERKQIEDALRESEYRWKFAIEGSGDGLWDWDVANGTVFFTKRWKEMLGFTEDEIGSGLDEWASRIHPDDKSDVLAVVQEYFDGKIPAYTTEHRVSCKDGSYKWVLDRGIVVSRDAEGKPLRMIGTHTDITEHKQMEEKLRDSDAFNVSVLNSLTSHIAVLDAQGVIVAVNDAWRRFAQENDLSGFNQDMVGCNYLDACKNAFNQPYGDEANAAQAGIVAVLTGELKSFHLEYPCHSPSEQRWFYMNVSPLQGSRRGVVVSHKNITERKRAEEIAQAASQYARSLIEASLDPLVTISAEGKITDVNTATEQVTGVARANLIGSDFANYFINPDKAREGYQQVFSQGFVTDYPLAIHHVSGKVTEVLYNATLYRDGNGNVLGVFAAARDITERKQIEAELIRSNADLEQFAYAVSHDMRQPLRMVSSYLSLIENALTGQLNEETQQFLYFAIDGAKRMDAMILSLLDYSRVGRKTEAKTLISSKASLNEALAFLNPELSACGGEINVTGDWPELFASRDELTRLLQNLVGNALKYHEENQPPRVHIHGTACDESLRVEVRDQGIGIEPSQMDRLFKVFSRLQARSRFEGTGVGLALCRKIVEHHGGSIGVASAGEGQGCMFWFELPVANAVNSD